MLSTSIAKTDLGSAVSVSLLKLYLCFASVSRYDPPLLAAVL